MIDGGRADRGQRSMDGRLVEEIDRRPLDRGIGAIRRASLRVEPAVHARLVAAQRVEQMTAGKAGRAGNQGMASQDAVDQGRAVPYCFS